MSSSSSPTSNACSGDAEPAMAPPRVLVLSCCHVRNFGDRLGFHLINAVLPPDVETTFHPLWPWQPPVRQDWDLVVLGIGNSLNPQMVVSLHDPLMALMERSRHSIGIFGTQYRPLYDRRRLAGLIGGLDHWYVRYRDDLELAGSQARASHLGDWLIDAFPLVAPTKDRMLKLEGDILTKRRGLDWLIQEIQAYRYVFSPRLHPLLCALCSAEQVAYVEQHDVGHRPELVSGKFAAMLQDVFGRTWPERDLFPVDRAAVIAYRRMVRANIAAMRGDIAAMLQSSVGSPSAVQAPIEPR